MSVRRSAQRAEAVFFAADKGGKPASPKLAKEFSKQAPRDGHLLASSKDYTAYRQIIWDLISINSNFEDMRRHWAPSKSSRLVRRTACSCVIPMARTM